MIMFSRGKIDFDEKQKLLEDSLKVTLAYYINVTIFIFSRNRYILLFLFSDIPDIKGSFAEDKFVSNMFSVLGCRFLPWYLRIVSTLCQ